MCVLAASVLLGMSGGNHFRSKLLHVSDHIKKTQIGSNSSYFNWNTAGELEENSDAPPHPPYSNNARRYRGTHELGEELGRWWSYSPGDPVLFPQSRYPPNHKNHRDNVCGRYPHSIGRTYLSSPKLLPREILHFSPRSLIWLYPSGVTNCPPP